VHRGIPLRRSPPHNLLRAIRFQCWNDFPKNPALGKALLLLPIFLVHFLAPPTGFPVLPDPWIHDYGCTATSGCQMDTRSSHAGLAQRGGLQYQPDRAASGVTIEDFLNEESVTTICDYRVSERGFSSVASASSRPFLLAPSAKNSEPDDHSAEEAPRREDK
jgi:hypothetical protein